MAQTFTLIVLVVLSVGGYSTAGDLAALEKIADKCREGTMITKDIIGNLMKSNADASAVDQNTKCYFKCLLDNIGMMHADGTIEVDAAHQHFSDCVKTTNDSDACDKAFNFHKCIHAQHPDLPII